MNSQYEHVKVLETINELLFFGCRFSNMIDELNF